ncbi:MAG: FlgD immunoglobulin-like domain containing protein [Candidatus Eiseniibacteriota bacterium]
MRRSSPVLLPPSPYYPAAVRAVFRVDRSWKGDPPATTRLLTAASDISCGYTFVPGARYLVYAFQGVDGWESGSDPSALWTSLCWRTHPYSPEDPDLAALGRTRVLEFRAPFPSPSSGDVAFDYTLGAESQVELSIYDLGGRQVRVLVGREAQSAGPHQRIWDGRDRAGRVARAGIYVAALAVGGERFERRFALLR